MVTTSVNLTDNKYTGRSVPVTLIGIHTMEAPEGPQTAENVANYFKSPAVAASAHWCVDDNSRVRCVEDADCAWTMPPTNHYSLNVEMAGYAAQTPSQWADQYSLLTLDNAALCVAEWCHKYDIPVRHLTDAQIANYEKGLAGHVDVNRVFHGSTHTDPGPNFPWDAFLKLVNEHLDVPSPTPPVAKGKPNCSALQSNVHCASDNQWGADTDKHFSALVDVTSFSGRLFPYGVAFTQEVVGANQDGVWGPQSTADLDKTVALVQTNLKAMGFNPGNIDGVWGPSTNKAYEAARAACHI